MRTVTKIKHGNQYILVITNHFAKLPKAVSVSKTSSTYIATVFVDRLTNIIEVPSTVRTDNVPQFNSKIFIGLCNEMQILAVTTSKYHPKTNVQLEKFNPTQVSRLWHYVSEHQCDWDAFLSPLTYMNSVRVHRSTNR